jgi:hypothetical protein
VVASAWRVRVTPRRVYAVGALAAVLFGYDLGIIGAAILFIRRDVPLTAWQQGAVVGAAVFGAMVGALSSGLVARSWPTALLRVGGRALGWYGDSFARWFLSTLHHPVASSWPRCSSWWRGKGGAGAIV